VTVGFKPRLDLGHAELRPAGDMPMRQSVFHATLNPPDAASKVPCDATLVQLMKVLAPWDLFSFVPTACTAAIHIPMSQKANDGKNEEGNCAD